MSTPTEQQAEQQEQPAYAKQYSALQAKLPTAISSRLPSSVAVEAGVNITSERLSTLTAASKVKLEEGKVKYGELRRTGSQRAGELQTFTKETWKTRGPESLATQAWSVTNETQVALNVSLNRTLSSSLFLFPLLIFLTFAFPSLPPRQSTRCRGRTALL
jgi:hypothetical protein